ncbi:MAG: MFS transporter [Pseudomonadota bacterium]
MSQRLRYLLATGSWFFANGLHAVIFSWVITMQLNGSPLAVGFAQMAFLLPTTLLILIGGSVADRVGGRLPAMAAQALATVASLGLILVMSQGQVGYAVMLVYAVVLGTAVAFLTPARDALLNQVAGGRVQRTVMLVSMVQFGLQIVGALIARAADAVGPQTVLMLQAGALLFGVLCFYSLRTVTPEQTTTSSGSILTGLLDGARAVIGAPALRVIVLQNLAMGVLFMGSYIVLFPLLVRETFGGQVAELSLVAAINSFGLVLTILLLLRLGDVRNQGRALIASQVVGSIVLFTAASMSTFGGFLVLVFIWGLCGGLAMTMARTIMQEQAPPEMRGRVMSFYSFSFMGAGPLGAAFCGLLGQWLGPAPAIMVAAGSMLTIMLIVALRSVLPRVRSTELIAVGDAGGPA